MHTYVKELYATLPVTTFTFCSCCTLWQEKGGVIVYLHVGYYDVGGNLVSKTITSSCLPRAWLTAFITLRDKDGLVQVHLHQKSAETRRNLKIRTHDSCAFTACNLSKWRTIYIETTAFKYYGLHSVVCFTTVGQTWRTNSDCGHTSPQRSHYSPVKVLAYMKMPLWSNPKTRIKYV